MASAPPLGEVVVDVSGNIDKLLRDFAEGKRQSDQFDAALSRGLGQTVKNLERFTDSLSAAERRLGNQFSDSSRSAERFSQQINRAKQDTVEAARATDTAMVSLRRTLLSSASIITAALGVNEIRNMADAYTTFTNRIKAAGDEGSVLQQRQEQLFEIAQRYGVQLNVVGALYGRMTQAQNELGASSGQIITAVNGASAAVRIFGSSTEEQQGALLQLSQMLGDVNVRAQEFNSVNQGARPILQAAATGIERFHGSIAALRQAVINQNVTSREFFQGWIRGMQILDQVGQASRLPLTLGASFTTLNNAIGQYIGQTNEAYSVTQRISMGIGELANNLNVIMPILTAIVIAIGTRYVAALSAATLASIRKAATDAAATLAANALATSTGRVTTSMGAASASEVITAASSARLAASFGAAALGAGAVSVEVSAMSVVMATAGGIAATVGRTILAAFGGWVGVAIMAVVGAVILYERSVAQAQQEVDDFNEHQREAGRLLAEEARQSNTARGEVAQLGQAHQTATGYVRAFAGATGDAADQLHRQAEEARNARVELLRHAAAVADADATTARQRADSFTPPVGVSARYGDIRSTQDVADQAAAQARATAAETTAARLRAAADAAAARPLESYLSPNQRTQGRDIAAEMASLQQQLVAATRAHNEAAMRELNKQIRIRRRITEFLNQGLSMEIASAQAEAEALGAAPHANPGRDVERARRGTILSTAQQYLGMNEHRDRSPLEALFREANQNIDPSITKWCAAFVNAVLAHNGLPTTGSLGAASFDNYGRRTTSPVPGDIVTLHLSGNATDHVGIFAGFDAHGGVRVVGGNQGDHHGGGVTTSTFRPNQVSSFRQVPTVDEAERMRNEQIAHDESAARELEGLNTSLLQSRREQTVDAAAQAQIERERINSERDREKTETEARQQRGEYSEAQAASILAANEVLRAAQIHAIDLREQQRQEQEANRTRAQTHETEIAILEGQQESARTETERRTIERRILAAQKEYERLVLQATIDSPFTTPLDRRLAQADMASLNSRYDARGASINQRTRTDLLNSAPAGSATAHRQEIQAIRDQEEERLKTVQEALDARQILEAEAAQRRVEIERDAQDQIRQAQISTDVMRLQSAQQTADSLAQIATALFGEHSRAARAMFIVSKGFAIAEAVLQLQVALAKALALGFPQNIPAIASVAAIGASIISNIVAIGGQFDSGGWTGDGPAGSYAGMVHGQEFVIKAGPAAQYRDMLETINSGRDPTAALRAGGAGGGGMGRLSVAVHNHAPGVEHEVRQIGPNEIEIIAKKVVQRDAPGVVAADISNPNGKTSKALTRHSTNRRARP